MGVSIMRTVLVVLLASVLVALPGRVRAGDDGVVGADTGFGLALDFSADLDGDLENCGCRHRPMGGLVWRAGYASLFAKATSGQVPLLQVDAGHSLSAVAGPNGLGEEARVRDDYMLRAFESLHVTAANASYRDVAYLAIRMRSEDYEKNVKQFPALESFVSANLTPVDAAVRPFKPYVIREVQGARLGPSPVRVGFLGVTEAPVLNGQLAERLGAYRISDPVEAAKKLVPELRKKCDLVVVLAYVDRNVAKRIAAEAPGVDLVLAGHQFPIYNVVDEANGTVVAYASNQTKWLGEIRLYRSADSKSMMPRYEHRDVPLDAAIPDDPAAVRLVEQSRAEIAKARPTKPAAPAAN
jgi:hypothetical protein